VCHRIISPRASTRPRASTSLGSAPLARSESRARLAFTAAPASAGGVVTVSEATVSPAMSGSTLPEGS